MEKQYTLIDGVWVNNQFPETFEIPSDDEKAFVDIGDYVKLGFQNAICYPHPAHSERMWVNVTGRRYIITDDNVVDTLFVGILDNDPINNYDGNLVIGTTIEFVSKHILSIIKTNITDKIVNFMEENGLTIDNNLYSEGDALGNLMKSIKSEE